MQILEDSSPEEENSFPPGLITASSESCCFNRQCVSKER